MTFNPLNWFLDILQQCWNVFYNLWVSVGAWDLLLGMLVIFITFRMFLVPLFGGRLSFGSDRVRGDRDEIKFDSKGHWYYGNTRGTYNGSFGGKHK